MNSNLIETISITEDIANIRVDLLLKELFPSHSRTYFQYLIENQAVLLNGNGIKKKDKAKVDDFLEVRFLKTEEICLEPQEIPLSIIAEDDHFIAINKPQGMVVHPAPGHHDQTFVNALLYHFTQLPLDDTLRPGIVHRLDKDTSGILIAAKTREMHQALVALFAERKMKKEYLAITCGTPKVGFVDQPIARDLHKRQQMCICHERGKTAYSTIEVIAENGPLSLVKVLPTTGRTHQIRVHLKSVHTPILGDPVYGLSGMNAKYGIDKQCLHAYQLSFIHPFTNNPVVLKAPLPKEMRNFFPESSQQFS